MKKILATLLITTTLATSTVTVFAQETMKNPVIADQFHYEMNVAAVEYVYYHSQGYRYESPDEILQNNDLDYCYGNIEYMDAVINYLVSCQKVGAK